MKVNKVIPVPETEISDEEMSFEGNEDLELGQHIRGSPIRSAST